MTVAQAACPVDHGRVTRRPALRPARPLAALTALLALAGCPQDVRPLLDAGAADAGEDGPDGGSGTSDGGSEPLDAGAADAGAPGRAFAWALLSLPPGTRTITAIWGRSPTEIYLGTTSGEVIRFDGATFDTVWDVPNNFAAVDIAGTATRVFVVGQRDLYVHAAGFGQPEVHSVPSDVRGLAVVSDTLAFVVAQQTNSRGLFRYDGSRVEPVVPNLSVASVNAVWAEPGPAVWIASNGRIPTWDGLALSEASVAWPPAWSPADVANFFLHDVAATSGGRVAVGTGGGVLVERTGGWTFERPPSGSEDFEAVAPIPGSSAPVAVAVGEDVDGHPVHWRMPDPSQGGFTWTPDPLNERVRLLDVWASGPDEVYAVGGARGSFDGVLLRGRRSPN